jgi:hypothetical protein
VTRVHPKDGYDPCPACDKPSIYDKTQDLFFHNDGTAMEDCWFATLRGPRLKAVTNVDNLAGWLDSGRTPAEQAIARRDADDRRRYGDRVDDPNPYTNEEQLTAVTQRYDELHDQLVDIDGLRKIEPPSLLIDGYLFHDSLAWLGGKPGHGKTFGAVDIACCVGTGTPWHGHDVIQGVVLYLIAEGASGLAQRVDAWALAHGKPVRNVLFLPVPVRLMNHIDVDAFAQLVMNIDADLVIVDTQARVTVGAEENSSKDMGRFVDNLEHIRRHTGACVLVVHHEPRNGENLRGSTALEGAATTILRAAKDGNVVELTNPKQKDTPEQSPKLLALKPIGSSAYLSHEMAGEYISESERHTLTVLRTFGKVGATKTELHDATGLPKTSWYRTINALTDKALVRKAKVGRSVRYTLPDDDQQDLSQPVDKPVEVADAKGPAQDHQRSSPETTGPTGSNESHDGKPA